MRTVRAGLFAQPANAWVTLRIAERCSTCRYFLLSQIRAQGDTVAGPREISDTVPLDHIPELMCAMGYYPTQSEITDIISNLASAAALRKEPKPSTVDLEKLLYLYYNFTPVAGVRPIVSIPSQYLASRMQDISTNVAQPALCGPVRQAL